MPVGSESSLATCGLAGRAADPVCACGGKRKWATPGETLPLLAAMRGVEVITISGKDTGRLVPADGMGGWLRLKARSAHG
jgi:hypothetical protein